MSGFGPGRGHVQIRDVQDGDVEAFFDHQQDPEATRMAAFPARGREAFVAHWVTIRADKRVVTATILVDGRVAGNLVSWDQEGHHEIGYWLGRRFWGGGIATAALALFVDQVRARPLRAYVATHNRGSMRVLEKCGFTRDAVQDVPSSSQSEVEQVLFVLEK